MNTNPNHPNDRQALKPESLELAALYSMGLMSSDESDAFETLLLAGNKDAIDAFEYLRPIGEQLLAWAANVGPVDPRLIVRSNLINSLGLRKSPPPFSQTPATSHDAFSQDLEDLVLLRSSSVDWVETGVPGARSRMLYVDEARGRMSLLLQLDPGTAFPDHEHSDVEECLVLDGDIELGGKTLRKFDYMRIPKGGQHGTPRTVSGCLLLVTCGIAA